jgi:hypothetical protein
MDITPRGVVKQQMAKAKNLKTLSLRKDYVYLTTVLIHIYILGIGSYSAIDLIVAGPSLLLDFSWKVHDDLCGCI